MTTITAPSPSEPDPNPTDPASSGDDLVDTVLLNDGRGTVSRRLADWLATTAGHEPARVHLVTAFVSVRGLLALTDALATLIDRGHEIRLLIGVSPEETAQIWRRIEPVEPSAAPPGADDAPQASTLCGHADTVLRADLNGTSLSGAQLQRLLRLVGLLKHERVECRRYERGFLHAKLTIVDGPGGVHAVAGSSNLSLGGLARNHEFNAVQGPSQAGAALAATRRWWQDAAEYDLAALIAEVFVAQPVPLVYLRMLHEAYGAEVNAPPSPVMDLFDYQRDGVARVMAILDRHHGALIADEVGLGKTFTVGEIARRFTADGRGPVLVVAPAALQQMWRDRLADWGLGGVQILTYDKLVALHRKVTDEGHTWLACGLLLLDEAHAIRNPLTQRMLAVRSLLAAQAAAGRPTRVVTMTATPVNNTGGDQFEILALADQTLDPAWQQAPTFATDRAAMRPSDGQRMAEVLADPLTACQTDKAWYYQMAHSRMLRRDRTFIRHAYPTRADGQTFTFPAVEQTPVPIALTDDGAELFAAVLDAVGFPDLLPARLEGILAAVRPDGRPRPLSFEAYPIDPRYLGYFRALMRCLLLKRLESSYAALASTTSNMIDRIRDLLDERTTPDPHRLDPHAPTPTASSPGENPGAPEEDLDGDDIAFLADLTGRHGSITRAAADEAWQPYRAALEADLEILQDLHRRARTLIATDPKKQALADLLLKALDDPRGPKILIFSGSRTTTHDLGIWLTRLIDRDPRYAALRGRIANLGALPEPSAADAEAVLAGFAPKTAATGSTEATRAPAPDLYDVLICTDKFSEGVNLQQAALCVHYDLTWNPQRLGQRVGRLDRVGSTHALVTCWTLLPHPAVDDALKIMGKLHRKALIAAETVGVPTPLFPDCVRRPYTDLFPDTDDHDSERHSTSGAEPDGTDPHEAALRDHGWATAWLGTAHREPAAAAALAALPQWAGAIDTRHRTDPSVIFCFRLHHPGTSRSEAVFAQLYTGSRRGGHLCLDPDRILRNARIDPTTWVRRTAAGHPDPGGIPLTDQQISDVADLLDRARTALADAHGIPASDAEQRLHPVCWILQPTSTPGSPR